MKYLYMMVTEDKYELPVIVCDSVKELARKVGVRPDSISACIYNYKIGKIKSSRYRKVKYE